MDGFLWSQTLASTLYCPDLSIYVSMYIRMYVCMYSFIYLTYVYTIPKMCTVNIKLSKWDDINVSCHQDEWMSTL